MAISHFTDNKFGISRFTRKKNFLYDQSLLLWVITKAKELLCSMPSPFSCSLFLVLWKGKESRDLPSLPRSGSRIDADRFPKQAPKLLGGPGVCSPEKCFGF